MQEADTLLIKELAAGMCRAQGPAMALSEAAKACSSNTPAVVFVGLAVLARDKQSVRYAVLLARQRAAEQLGSISPSSAAAGIAILTKQQVHVRDINTGDLGMEDLQYLSHMHGAQSFFAAPLIVAQSSTAALCVASADAHAIAGREEFLQVVAAMCAPYLTLLTSNLPALEGLVKQVLPVRVALQLQESAAQQQQERLLQAPASPGNNRQAAAASLQHTQGASSSSSGGGAGTSSSAAAPQQQLQQHPDNVGQNDGPWSAQPPRWQRQRQLRSRNPLLQQQLQQQQATGQASEQQLPSDGQTQQRSVLESGLALWPLLSFRQPQLEHAYRISACRQWQQWLDLLFLLLSLASAIGGRLGGILSAAGSPLVMLSLLLVVAIVLWVLLQRLLALPVPDYLRLRVPVIAAVRLLRVLLFCVEAWQLPSQVFHRPAAAAAAAAAAAGEGLVRLALLPQLQLRQLLRWSHAEVAGCGVLVMQGLAGQLPLAWHAVVQAAAVAALFGSLPVIAGTQQGGGAAAAAAPAGVVVVQLLVGWLLPVLVVAVTECHTRMVFLHSIR